MELRALNKGVLGGSVFLLMLAVFCYVYEVTVYTEFLGMRVPYRKEYPYRNLSFVLGFLGILLFGVGVALPSRYQEKGKTYTDSSSYN